MEQPSYLLLCRRQGRQREGDKLGVRRRRAKYLGQARVAEGLAEGWRSRHGSSLSGAGWSVGGICARSTVSERTQGAGRDAAGFSPAALNDCRAEAELPRRKTLLQDLVRLKISRIAAKAVAVFFATSVVAWCAVTGGISGVVSDPTGAVIAGVAVTSTNTAQGSQTKTTTDDKGFYNFPRLPVGSYDIQVELQGFAPQKKSAISVDADASVRMDFTLQVSEQSEQVTVSESANEVHVETSSTQVGEIVSQKEMTTVALNGRSYTDLLALQPGIVPMSTQTGQSVVMAGASVAIAPSGGLNPGNQSISGQREDANGFLVNGGDVKELMNGGTAIIPDLDSIAEFRVLTNNFDAEYGNYSGGIVNVVTKSGDNKLHGTAFEFLRNTALDARNFF